MIHQLKIDKISRAPNPRTGKGNYKRILKFPEFITEIKSYCKSPSKSCYNSPSLHKINLIPQYVIKQNLSVNLHIMRL